jgi:hypothetical protein
LDLLVLLELQEASAPPALPDWRVLPARLVPQAWPVRMALTGSMDCREPLGCLVLRARRALPEALAQAGRRD